MTICRPYLGLGSLALKRGFEVVIVFLTTWVTLTPSCKWKLAKKKGISRYNSSQLSLSVCFFASVSKCLNVQCTPCITLKISLRLIHVMQHVPYAPGRALSKSFWHFSLVRCGKLPCFEYRQGTDLGLSCAFI